MAQTILRRHRLRLRVNPWRKALRHDVSPTAQSRRNRAATPQKRTPLSAPPGGAETVMPVKGKSAKFADLRKLSTKPGSVRQRRVRARHRAGEIALTLWVPQDLFEQAARKREGLPDNAPVSRRQLRRSVEGGLEWWAERWVGLEGQDPVTRDNRDKDKR